MSAPPPHSGKDWIKLNTRKDRSLPSLPSEACKEERSANWDEQALESAVEGREVDLEKGRS